MIKNFFKNHPIHKKIVIYFDLFNLLAPLNYFLEKKYLPQVEDIILAIEEVSYI